VTETLLVSDAQSTPQFKAAVGDGGSWAMSVSYAEVGAEDVCSALDAARPFLDDRLVVVQHADALFGDRLGDDIAGFQADGLDALALMVPPGYARTRPGHGMTGCWLFSAQAITTLLSGPWPEDPMLGLRRQGAQVRTLNVEGCLACHGGEDALLRANRHALDRLRSDYSRAELLDSETQGPVVIHPTAVLEHTLVRGPAIIGPGAHLSRTYIGPYTSIGARARLEGTEIEHAIVMEDAVLLNVGSRLETSIIGRGASIVRRFDMPRAVRLSIGDGAEVRLS
jgi:glucose-1-phosphate thymidylyltransferase